MERKNTALIDEVTTRERENVMKGAIPYLMKLDDGIYAEEKTEQGVNNVNVTSLARRLFYKERDNFEKAIYKRRRDYNARNVEISEAYAAVVVIGDCLLSNGYDVKQAMEVYREIIDLKKKGYYPLGEADECVFPSSGNSILGAASTQPTETPAASTQPTETPAASTPLAETPAASTPLAETPAASTQPAETSAASTQPAETSAASTQPAAGSPQNPNLPGLDNF